MSSRSSVDISRYLQVEGQYVGKIEAGSPAESGGLQNGDRVVEVNGDNVENKSHKKVVRKIR